jgi:hypothetical protein
MRFAVLLAQVALLAATPCFAQTNEVDTAINEMLGSIRTRIIQNKSDYQLLSQIEIPEIVTKGAMRHFSFESGRLTSGTKVKSPTWSKDAISVHVSVEYPMQALYQSIPVFQMQFPDGLVLECRYGAFVSDRENQTEVFKFIDTIQRQEMRKFTDRLIALGGKFKRPF